MTQITITLNKIIDHDPCSDGWENILKGRGKAAADDEEFPLSEAFESNSLDDVIWALRCLPEHDRLWRKFAVWCARQVQDQSINALEVAWRHSIGEATDEELQAARDAAWAEELQAARDAAWAERIARDDAWAARAAACVAACAAAWAARADAWAAWAAARAARAAWAARDAAWAASAAHAAARTTALDAARAAQKAKLIQILDAGEWVE